MKIPSDDCFKNHFHCNIRHFQNSSITLYCLIQIRFINEVVYYSTYNEDNNLATTTREKQPKQQSKKQTIISESDVLQYFVIYIEHFTIISLLVCWSIFLFVRLHDILKKLPFLSFSSIFYLIPILLCVCLYLNFFVSE